MQDIILEQHRLSLKLIFDKETGKIFGAQALVQMALINELMLLQQLLKVD